MRKFIGNYFTYMREMRYLFHGLEFLIILTGVGVVIFGFNVFVTGNLVFSFVVSALGVVYFLVVFLVPDRRLNRYQENLNELLKYVTNMVFFMQTGENVLYALRNVRASVNREIADEITKVVEGVEKEAKLSTSNFKKFDFTALDQFHQNLEIKFDRGGSAQDLFSQIQNNMVFELKKRDELYKRKKGYAFNVYVLVGFIFAMILILRLFVTTLWEIFLSYQIASLGVLFLVYFLLAVVLYFIQKHKVDISVRL